MPDESPCGHMFGFGMSRNTRREEIQGEKKTRGEEDKDEDETGMLFKIIRQNTGDTWVIESGARPNGDTLTRKWSDLLVLSYAGSFPEF